MSDLANRKIEKCRLCESDLLSPIISLGNQYINDFPPSIDQKGRNGECPLNVLLCENCKLYQLSHTAPQELLYSKHYWYKSGISNTITIDLKNITEIAKLYIQNTTVQSIYITTNASLPDRVESFAKEITKIDKILNLLFKYLLMIFQKNMTR